MHHLRRDEAVSLYAMPVYQIHIKPFLLCDRKTGDQQHRSYEMIRLHMQVKLRNREGQASVESEEIGTQAQLGDVELENLDGFNSGEDAEVVRNNQGADEAHIPLNQVQNDGLNIGNLPNDPFGQASITSTIGRMRHYMLVKDRKFLPNCDHYISSNTSENDWKFFKKHHFPLSWTKAPSKLGRLFEKVERLGGPFTAPRMFTNNVGKQLGVLPIRAALSHWLAAKNLYSIIKEVNENHTLPGLTSEARAPWVAPDVFSEQWDGSEWQDGPLRSKPDLGNLLREDLASGKTALVFHLNFFADGVTRMDTKTSELKLTVLSLTIGEIPKGLRGEGSVLGHIPLCIYKTDAFNVQDVLKSYNEELEMLRTGVDMYSVAGQETVKVYAFPALVVADYPASREVGGLCTTASARRPCSYCRVRQKRKPNNCSFGCRNGVAKILPENEYRDSIWWARFRRMCLRHQDRQLTAYMKKYSVKLADPAIASWPSMDFSACLTLDLMHQQFIGDTKRHFNHLIQKIESKLSNMKENGIPVAYNWEEWWKDLSRRFKSFLSTNGVHTMSTLRKLSDFNQLPAYSIMMFSRFSKCIFEDTNMKKPFEKAECQPELATWILRCEAVTALSQSSMTADEALKVGNDIEIIVGQCCRQYVKFCTVNSHNSRHWLDCIIRYGPPRCYWAFPFERKMSWLKSFFSKVNFKDAYKTITRRARAFVSLAVFHEVLQPGSKAHGRFYSNKQPSEANLILSDGAHVTFNGRHTKVGTHLLSRENRLVQVKMIEVCRKPGGGYYINLHCEEVSTKAEVILNERNCGRHVHVYKTPTSIQVVYKY